MSRYTRLRDMAGYLLSPRSIEVFGMFGPGNLGDEAMRVAAIKALPGRVIGTVSPTRFAPIQRVMAARTRPHIMVAGGTLIHGGAPDGSNPWLSHIEHRVSAGARLACFGTGVAFLPEQVEARSDSWKRWADLLRQADHVALRGPMSCSVAAGMGVKAEVFGDFAFLLHDPALLVAPSVRDMRIGLNIGECRGDQQAHEDIWAAIVRRLAPSYALDFFVVTPGDMAATRRVIAASKIESAVTVRAFYYDPFAFMQAAAALKLFIGLKLHGAGLALIAGVPSLLFSYEEKCRDFMQAIGGEACLLTLGMTAEDVVFRVEAALARPDEVTFSDAIGTCAVKQRDTLLRHYGA